VTDTAGLPKFQAYLFDVVQNLNPTTVGLDLRQRRDDHIATAADRSRAVSSFLRVAMIFGK